MSKTKAVRAHITGRVQRVAFRAWTQREARLRGLGGWVRNEADGSVTALIAGPVQAVDDMTRALRHGPPAAWVTGVELAPGEAPEGEGFRILR